MNEVDILIKALEMSPENSVLRKHIAELQLKNNLFEEAYGNFNILLEEKYDLEVLEGKLECLIELKRFEEAKQAADKELNNRD
ncbi:MAG: hypothetical protein PHX70_13670, partial [Clostridium sp.]|nr:hypothetical protein [Clostridium sp.]